MRLKFKPISEHEEKIIIGYSYIRNNFQVAFTLLFSLVFFAVGIVLFLISSSQARILAFIFLSISVIVFLSLVIYLQLTKTILILDHKKKQLIYDKRVFPKENAELVLRRTFKISRTLLGVIPFVPEYDAYWELFYVVNEEQTRILFFKQQLIDRIRDLPEIDHLTRYLSGVLELPVVDETGIEHLYLKPKFLGKPFIEHLETCYTETRSEVLPKKAIINKRREKNKSTIYAINRMPSSKNLVYPALPIAFLEIVAFIPLLAVLIRKEPTDVIKLVFMGWFFPVVVISWLLYFYLIKDAYSEDIFIITSKGIELAYKNLFYIRMITRIPLMKLQLIILPKLNDEYMIEFVSENHRVHTKGRYHEINDVQALKKSICDELEYLLKREKH